MLRLNLPPSSNRCVVLTPVALLAGFGVVAFDGGVGTGGSGGVPISSISANCTELGAGPLQRCNRQTVNVVSGAVGERERQRLETSGKEHTASRVECNPGRPAVVRA